MMELDEAIKEVEDFGATQPVVSSDSGGGDDVCASILLHIYACFFFLLFFPTTITIAVGIGVGRRKYKTHTATSPCSSGIFRAHESDRFASTLAHKLDVLDSLAVDTPTVFSSSISYASCVISTSSHSSTSYALHASQRF